MNPSAAMLSDIIIVLVSFLFGSIFGASHQERKANHYRKLRDEAVEQAHRMADWIRERRSDAAARAQRIRAEADEVETNLNIPCTPFPDWVADEE